MSDSAADSGKLPFKRIVWPLAVAETLVWAAMYYSFPALLLEWERDLGWSKAELTGAFTSALVVAAVLAPFAGRLIDQGHGIAVFAGGATLGAMLLGVLSLVTAPWQFYCVWLGMGVAMSGSLYEACFAILTHSMGAQAKRAITLVTLVAGFAGTVSFPTAHALTGVLGWRGTVVVFAGAIVLVALPLIWMGCRAAKISATVHAPVASPRSAHAVGALRSWTFWGLAFAFGAVALDHGMIITHLLPMLDERGVQPQAAVLAASMIGPMQVTGRLAMMAVERHVSMIAIAGACFIAMAGAAGALLGASVVSSLIVAFVILQGAGNGVTSIARPVLVAELLGRRDFGVISGLLAVAYVAGYAAGPTVGSIVWELGGYQYVLLLAISVCIAGLGALLAAARVASAQR